MIAAAAPRTPVTVVAGPGKAVLLEHLARDPALARSVALTAGGRGLVADQPPEGEAPVRLGCVCCTVQGDLRRSLRALLPRARRGDVTQVLVDAEAASDPIAVLTTLITDPVLAAVYRIGGIIAVVGGSLSTDTHRFHRSQRHGPARPGHLPDIGERSHLTLRAAKGGAPWDGDGPVEPGHDGILGDPGRDGIAVEPGRDESEDFRGERDPGSDPATRRLLMLADRVVDLGDGTVSALNPAAQVIAELPDAGVILEQDRFTPVTAATDAVVAVTLPDPVVLADMEQRLKESVLRPTSTHGVQRLFGVLNCVGESHPVAVDAVRHHLAPPYLLPAWPDGHTPRSRLIFMGAGLDGASIQAAFAGL